MILNQSVYLFYLFPRNLFIFVFQNETCYTEYKFAFREIYCDSTVFQTTNKMRILDLIIKSNYAK